MDVSDAPFRAEFCELSVGDKLGSAIGVNDLWGREKCDELCSGINDVLRGSGLATVMNVRVI